MPARAIAHLVMVTFPTLAAASTYVYSQHDDLRITTNPPQPSLSGHPFRFHIGVASRSGPVEANGPSGPSVR